MKYAVLGTGMVGTTLATKLVALGHEVVMGARKANNENAAAWVASVAAGPGAASAATFGDAVEACERVINATAGQHSLAALALVGPAALDEKLLIDVANPLDFSQGMPPTLTICNDSSLGEQIQALFPMARVVKTLNTCNCEVMVTPGLVPGDHDMFLCGNDQGAKDEVAELLRAFGWTSLIDLGDITQSRGTEQFLPLWLRLWGHVGHPHFNISVRTGAKPAEA